MQENTYDVSNHDLPRDLLETILAKLSPRDVLISMSVCKSWRAIIRDDSSFRYMHHKHSRRASISDDRKAGLVVLAIHDGTYEAICLGYASDFHLDRGVTSECRIYRAVTSCDGLVLLSSCRWEPRLHLWNPAIRKMRSVPSSGVADNQLGRIEGFGCIEYNDKYDYKIVEVHYPLVNGHSLPRFSDENNHVMVYSLSRDSWRRIRAIPPCYPRNMQDYGVFVNDSVHWPAKSKEGCMVIMGFDLREEVFWEVPVPADYNNNHDINWILAACEGLLSIVGVRRVKVVKRRRVEIWVMKEHRVGASWSEHRLVGPMSGVKVMGCFKGRMALPERRFEKVVECPIMNVNKEPVPDATRALGLTTYLESLALFDDNHARFIQLR